VQPIHYAGRLDGPGTIGNSNNIGPFDVGYPCPTPSRDLLEFTSTNDFPWLVFLRRHSRFRTPHTLAWAWLLFLSLSE